MQFIEAIINFGMLFGSYNKAINKTEREKHYNMAKEASNAINANQ